jgi:hypothetical protein
VRYSAKIIRDFLTIKVAHQQSWWAHDSQGQTKTWKLTTRATVPQHRDSLDIVFASVSLQTVQSRLTRKADPLI